jgi:hypothetical protein
MVMGYEPLLWNVVFIESQASFAYPEGACDFSRREAL